MPTTDPSRVRSRVRAWERDQRLASLGFSDYGAYIHSPTWRAVKRRYRDQHPWICNICGTEESLELHHRTYDRVGEERLDDLMPLCADCHEMVHVLERRGDATLDFEGIINTSQALHNRATMAAKREAVESEQQADAAALKEFLETLPLSKRLKRLRGYSSGKSGAAKQIRSQRRILHRRLAHGEASYDFILRRVRAMENIAYRL